jgi:hypothetical protein
MARGAPMRRDAAHLMPQADCGAFMPGNHRQAIIIGDAAGYAFC